jgi:hypothetical protein
MKVRNEAHHLWRHTGRQSETLLRKRRQSHRPRLGTGGAAAVDARAARADAAAGGLAAMAGGAWARGRVGATGHQSTFLQRKTAPYLETEWRLQPDVNPTIIISLLQAAIAAVAPHPARA